MLGCKKIFWVSGVSLVLLAVSLAACQSDQPEINAADLAEGRANVEAMAEQHAHDTTEPSEAVNIEPSRPVVSERLPYAEVEDDLVYGHFVFPADMVDPLPAIIVIHEWWGLNDNVRAMADRLAGEGYIVLAVDLFGGEVANSPGEARELMLSVVENPEPAKENIRQAYSFIENTGGAPRIGALGWCFGGGWALNTAMLFPDQLDAAVIYYGQVTDDEEKLRPINVPILGLFGEADQGITVDSVQRFERALEALRKDFQIHIYPGADHAFANPTGTAYDANAAEDAWEETLEFLSRNLAEEDPDQGP